MALTRWRQSFCSGFESVADEIRKESVAQVPEVASVATPTRTRPDCFRVQLNGPLNVWLVSVYAFTVCLLLLMQLFTGKTLVTL